MAAARVTREVAMEQVWVLQRALAVLDVDWVEFDSDGPLPPGTHGWSRHCRDRGRNLIAITPETHLPPDLIAFHELGHIVLRHGQMSPEQRIQVYPDREVQAMRITVALGEEFLSESAEEWRKEMEDYIAEFLPRRYAPESDDGREKVRSTIRLSPISLGRHN